MFRSVQPTVWAFDCEWVPDADAGRRLLGLPPETPEADVFEAMWAAARERGGAAADAPRPYLKTALCRVASVAVVERRVHASGAVALHLCSLPRGEDDPEGESMEAGDAWSERALLGAFFDGL
ncbi:MAG: hypothetical protein R3362_08895, partial [Rhodothermales bacterium]|nr:hypothetical protein [Rhodothermales bacterium]